MPYLIQGLFFQSRLALGIGRHPKMGEVVVVNELLGQHMFAGAFWREEGADELIGLIQDAFGIAKISDIRITDDGIVFKKSYDGRSDVIDYRFTKRDGVSWVGEYSGMLTGTGVTRCVLTEVPESFFDSESITKLLGRMRAFDMPPPPPDLFGPDPVD